MSDNHTNNLREAEIDFAALWQTAWRYKYVIALSTVLFGGAAVALALTQKPVYRAEVVVTKVTDGSGMAGASLASQLGGLASIAGINIGATGGQDRESMAVLESRRLVEEFVTRASLLPLLVDESGKEPTLWHAVKRLRENVLTIREDTRKGRITVAVEWTDPKVAAQWANEIVALANEVIRSRALDGSKRNITYLKDQIARTDVVELQRVMYNLIEAETKTLMLANAKVEYAFNIVDPAVAPETRIKPRRTVMAATGLMLGFIVGLIVSFLLGAIAKSKSAAAISSKP